MLPWICISDATLFSYCVGQRGKLCLLSLFRSVMAWFWFVPSHPNPCSRDEVPSVMTLRDGSPLRGRELARALLSQALLSHWAKCFSLAQLSWDWISSSRNGRLLTTVNCYKASPMPFAKYIPFTCGQVLCPLLHCSTMKNEDITKAPEDYEPVVLILQSCKLKHFFLL